jgi:Fe-S oxidoreductase
MAVPVAREGEAIELLYWVGCAGSFDPDGQAVSRAMVKILNHLGVKYRVLGRRERCSGDPARRMGEEGLFQELARDNIARFGSHHVQNILTQCPHCFNTFKNEYPELGATFRVEHHSEFLARMLHDGRLKLPRGGSDQSITFHDPCYLGRVNGQTQAPRVVLNVLPSTLLVEMPRSGENSFCCGAGGGSMWLDTKGAERVENLRAKEAAATGAATIATGCPFCKSMLKAGVQSLDPQAAVPQVRDLAELVIEAEGL